MTYIKTQHHGFVYRDRGYYHDSVIGGPYAGEVDYNIYNSAPFVSWEDSLTGTRNPAFRYQIAHRLNATTEMSASRIKKSLKAYTIEGFWTHKSPAIIGASSWKRHTVLSGFPESSLPSDPASLSDLIAYNQAVRQLYQRCRSAQTALLAGETLGEIRETITALRSPFDGLQKRFRSLRAAYNNARHHRIGRRRNSYIRDTWLEYNFGWAPLFRSINSSIDALNLAASHIPESINVDAYGISQSGTISPPISSYFVSAGKVTEGSAKERVKVKFSGAIGVPRPSSLLGRQLTGLGFIPSQFVPTVWELLPYSFLVDYFVNVGDIINAFSAYDINLLRLQKTTIRERSKRTDVRSTYVVPDSGLVNQYAIVQPGHSEFKFIRVSRVKQDSFPIPRVEFKIPTHWKQIANLVALTRSFRSLDLTH